MGGKRAPPGERAAIAEALALVALDDKARPAIPFRFALWRLAQGMSIPPWVLAGRPTDAPGADWLYLCLEFARMESSVRVRREH